MTVPLPLAGLRVLLLDDDPDTLDAVCFYLELQGAVVMCVSSAADAITGCLHFAPHVIVSDLSMPLEDGFAFMTRLRASPPPQSQIPALALSALSQAEARDRAYRVGFQGFLTKPVEPPRLLENVQRLAAMRTDIAPG